MLKMNEEEARREIFARNAVLRSYPSVEGYNTGATLFASDASEYISYYVSVWAPNIYCETFRCNEENPPSFALSTGSGLAYIQEVKGSLGVIESQNNIVTPAQMVAAVRNAFMLSVSEAALVFRVSRPTIYQWEALEDMEQIRAHGDRTRIKELYRLAVAWTKLGPLTGRWLAETLQNGRSILDLLTATDIDTLAILNAHGQIKTVMGQLRQAEHARSLDAARAMKRSFGILAGKEKARRKGSF